GCFQDRLAEVTAERPYVLIKSPLSLSGRVTLPALRPEVPSFYIIGPSADSAPSALKIAPLRMSNGGGTAIVVPEGAHATLEGLVIVSSITGLDCASGSLTPTRLRLLRSYIGE